VYCFDDIKTGLSSNWLGLQFYEAVEPDGQLDPEQPLEEQRRATEELSEFKSRLDFLSSRDTEVDEYRVRDALQNATWSLQELSNSDFRSDTLEPVHAELADTQNLSLTERWKRIFLSANRSGPYDTDHVASACEDIEEVAKDPFDELRDALISETDTPPATQLLQRADAEMCMLAASSRL